MHKTGSLPAALMLGLAVGDALGVPVEFQRRGSFHISGMEGYGTHHQAPGTWSDDTSLAIALVDALRTGKLELRPIANNFVAWLNNAQFTPHGEVFDIGNATYKAIRRLEGGTSPAMAGGREEYDNGNGSLMRIAPLVFYLTDMTPQERYAISRDISSITHAHPISVTACFIYLEMLGLLLKGAEKNEACILLKRNIPTYRGFMEDKALSYFRRIIDGDIASVPEAEIKSGGYVVETLEASLWCFLNTSSYKDAVLKAVNLGGDTDTTGAVTGAMAGLYYGIEAIPGDWLNTLARRDYLIALAQTIPV